MPKNTLADWIIEQKKGGYTESQIRANLIQQGYKQNEVNNAIMLSRTSGKKTVIHTRLVSEKILICILTLFLLININKAATFFSLEVTGTSAIILHFAYFLAFAVVLYGIFRHEGWAWLASLAVLGIYNLDRIITVIALTVAYPDKSPYTSANTLVVWFASVIFILLWIDIFRNKAYFSKNFIFQKKQIPLAKIIFIDFIIALILIAVIMGYGYLSWMDFLSGASGLSSPEAAKRFQDLPKRLSEQISEPLPPPSEEIPKTPKFVDKDKDGMGDEWELIHGLNPNDPTDNAKDNDNDGLDNLEEYGYKTDPNNTDTDGDGVSDRAEVDAGTDPAKP